MTNFKGELQSFADDVFLEGQCRIIEGSEEDKKIIENLGIKFPNPDLALFEGVYLIADRGNKNRHYLSSDTIEKAVSTIKMKPVNYFHKREQPIGVYINGTFDKSVKSMRTLGILWRSLFPQQVKEIEGLIKSQNSGQSFELTYQKSSVRPNADIELFDITFKGGAILPRNKAACIDTSADVLASILQDETIVMGGINPAKGGKQKMTIEEILKAEEIVITNLDNEKLSNEEFEKQLEELHKNEEESVEYSADAKKLTYQERQNLSDSDFAYVKTIGGKKIRRFPIHDEAHVRNALARLPIAQGLSPAEKAAIKAKILRRARQLGMKDLLERHKSEACFSYEDVTSFIDEVTNTYAKYIAPDKLEEIISERIKKYIDDKTKADIEAKAKQEKFAERRKVLNMFSDEELKAFDILSDEIFDKLGTQNQIKILQRNIADLNWLKNRVTELEKVNQTANASTETPEQKAEREKKEAEDKIAKEKAEAERIEKEKKEKEAKEAEAKAKKDAEGKLLTHGIPKVDESVKTQMIDVTQKREEK